MPIGVEQNRVASVGDTEAKPERVPHRRYAPIPSFRDPGRLAEWYGDEPETCKRDWRRIWPILLHCGVLLAVFYSYHLEWPAFRKIAALCFAALPLHYLAPYRYKKPFFTAISIVGLGLVFGATTAAIVIAVSAVLIGVALAPIRWSIRVATIAALAVGAAIAQTRFASGSPLETVWPVLGSMFMFRMIIFLYEIKHSKKRESLVDVLGYFFILPNYCFLLFPVIDYGAMRRGYFASEIHSLQRVGLRLIFRGAVQMLAFRIVYHDLWIAPEEVAGAATLMRHLIANYLLYLHVSGQFHTACGMLHLYGYQLPETHHNYLLASGFTDYWRRINIYWKDFMIRIVFNPVAFRLKAWPRPAALSIATVAVFVATWALHGYQSFWIRGSWGFRAQDALFWGILGLFVLINIRFDLNRKGSSSRRTACGARGLALRALKIAATFAAITVLWSLWNCPSLTAWSAMFGRAWKGGFAS